ncbi:MAG TPA: restriction endonuclease, partial [Parafilimonas sp.]|nr:restriction endonuclease [Parafilimonas sp.]
SLDWKKYEAVTKYIYKTLGKQSGVKIKGYGSSCKITGKSGVAHQIDILTTHSDGVHEYQTAIECKYWKEKINKDIVMKVSEIIEDSGLNKGVIVSKSGFTQDGIEYAKYRNIGLVELREIEENDLEGNPTKFDVGVLEVHTKCVIHRPEILNIEIDSVEKIQLEKKFWKNRDIIMWSNGKQVRFANYIKEFQDELHLQGKLSQTITKRYEIPGGRLINEQTRSSVNINEITFTGVLRKIDKSSNLRFAIEDQVWLILKSLFEKKTFTFSKSGIIIEK